MIALGLGLSLAVSACRSESEQGSDAGGQSRVQRHKAAIAQFQTRLVQLKHRVSNPPEERACTEQALKAEPGSSSIRLLSVEQAYLKRYQNPAFVPYSGERATWKFLTTPALRKVKPAFEANSEQSSVDVLWKIKKLESEYEHTALIRPLTFELPKVEGDQFHAGRFEAWMVVFALASSEPLCATRVQAQSSQEVAGRLGQDRSRASVLDFAANVRRELEAAAARLNPRFVLVLG